MLWRLLTRYNLATYAITRSNGDLMSKLARVRGELADFLRSRRERLTPADVGLPSGGRRRTPGLRREEVAALLREVDEANAESGHVAEHHDPDDPSDMKNEAA